MTDDQEAARANMNSADYQVLYIWKKAEMAVRLT